MPKHTEVFLQKQRILADEIQRHLNLGLSQHRVAAAVGVAPETVGVYIRKFGLTRPVIEPEAHALSPEEKRNARGETRRQRILMRFPDIKNYLGKEPFSATAARYGVSRSRIHQIAAELGITPYRPDPPTYDIDPNVSIYDNAKKNGVGYDALRYYLQRNSIHIDFRANHNAHARKISCEKWHARLTTAFGSDTELRLYALARRMGWVYEDGAISRSAGPNAARLVKIGVLEKGGYGVYRLTARTPIASSPDPAGPSSAPPRCADGTPPPA